MIDEDPYYKAFYPLFIVISGPSGVGKDTITRMVMENRESFYFVVTATTRRPREGEVHGKNYFFLSQDEFASMIENDELLEYAVVYKDFKGVPKKQIRDALSSKLDVIMRVDVQGAATLRKLIPNAVFIFLAAESEEVLLGRLKDRKTETAEGLNIRIATARQEMKRSSEFDYRVVNEEDRQGKTVRQILCIIEAEHNNLSRKPISI